MSSRSSTERFMNFSSESVVSHPVSWVSSWVACCVFGWVLVLVVLFFLLRKTPGFLPNKNNTF